MRGIIADNDVEGIVAALVAVWLSDEWKEIWKSCSYDIESFASLGLARDATDAVIWETCQTHQVALITANRNAYGADSLEATIRRENQPSSLPVFTIANPRRVLTERSYAEQVAVRLLNLLIDIERFRGTGRMYVP